MPSKIAPTIEPKQIVGFDQDPLVYMKDEQSPFFQAPKMKKIDNSIKNATQNLSKNKEEDPMVNYNFRTNQILANDQIPNSGSIIRNLKD